MPQSDFMPQSHFIPHWVTFRATVRLYATVTLHTTLSHTSCNSHTLCYSHTSFHTKSHFMPRSGLCYSHNSYHTESHFVSQSDLCYSHNSYHIESHFASQSNFMAIQSLTVWLLDFFFPILRSSLSHTKNWLHSWKYHSMPAHKHRNSIEAEWSKWCLWPIAFSWKSHQVDRPLHFFHEMPTIYLSWCLSLAYYARRAVWTLTTKNEGFTRDYLGENK